MKAWYTTGTIAVVQGTKSIVGTGTAWKQDINGIGRGHALIISTATGDRIYEIDRVDDDTHIVTVSNVKEATASGLSYAIVNFMPSTLPDFGRKLSVQLSDYQTFFDSFQQLATGTGNVTLTAPDGTQVTVRSQQAWDAALNGKVTGVKQTSATDATLNAIMALAADGSGSFGLGGSAVDIPSGSDAIAWLYGKPSGFYRAAGGIANTPNTAFGWCFYVSKWTSSRSSIIAVQISGAGSNIFSGYYNGSQAAFVGWTQHWTSANLVKQTGQFDATAGSMMLNGAWGWGGDGRILGITSDADFLTFLRGATTPGSVLRINYNSAYAKQYGNSIYTKTGDLWSLVSVGSSGNPATAAQFGIRVAAGNSAGTQTVVHELWTDKNLVKQSNKIDTTAGAMLINEAFGLGANQTDYAIGNMNEATRNGFARYGSSIPGAPTASPGYGLLFGFDNTSRAQLVGDAGSDELRFRVTSGGAWRDWTRLINDASSQTINGAKKFTANVAVENAYPAISLASTRQALGTVGRMVRFEHDGLTNQPYFVRSNGNDSTGQVVLRFPMAASGVALVTGNNAVADSNGFWKTASPVVKLFADGTSELTSEAEGITTERLSEGVYRISGCLGLNADRAWGGDEGGIDVPMCRNKLPRLWVDYGGDEGSEQINPDGSIVIRTYHRPHPDAPAFARNEIEGYASGDPIDIPRDTFISVRVQMPEREEEKLKVMHSNVYCNTVAS